MSGLNALAVLDSQIAELRASGDTGNVENLVWARDAFAELAEATAAYLVGRKWYNPLYANKREFDNFAALEARLHAALASCGATP